MRAEANEIIVNLLQSDDFNHCMKKVKPALKQDLTSELAIILLETPPEKIVTLNDNRQLTFYTVRIILTLAFSKTSPFYKKYRLTHNEFKDTGAVDDHSIIDIKEREDRALTELEKLINKPDSDDNNEWFIKGMVNLYLECGNYREMEKRTRISDTTCYLTVKHAMKKIKQAI
jgi:hypothetical protein